jgi:hypothetical protein
VYDHSVNESIAAVLVGVLLSLSGGVRITVPLLAVSLLAAHHAVTLPSNLAWMSTETTVIILSVACAAETLVYFIPAAGTGLRAVATPLAFAAGTLLMAVPLGDRNPLYQWTLAGAIGGGAAALTHLGVTGARVATGPANVATLGVFGIFWNLGECFFSLLLAALGGVCVFVGGFVAIVLLVVIAVALLFIAIKAIARSTRRRHGLSPMVRAGSQEEALP